MHHDPAPPTAGHTHEHGQKRRAPDNTVNLTRLRRSLGFSDDTAENSRINPGVGREVLDEMAAITLHQWRPDATRGLVKGFLLHGPPGTGKTTLAKRLTVRLGEVLAQSGRTVALMTIDGAEIARSKYGESEQQIREIFARAASGVGYPDRRIVLLFDDVESIFMERGSSQAREWHFSQDSTFFHTVDELDTRQVVVILTTNRPDLVDEAIRDRFLQYGLAPPSPEVLAGLAQSLAAEQGLGSAEAAAIARDSLALAEAGELNSLRAVERWVLRRYVRAIVGPATGDS